MKRAALAEEDGRSVCHMMMVPSDRDTNRACESIVYARLQHTLHPSNKTAVIAYDLCIHPRVILRFLRQQYPVKQTDVMTHLSLI